MKHVLVFGTTGTGKTTLIKHLVPGADLETSSSARGVTWRTEEVSTRHKGIEYRIIDTVGLDEASKGKIPADKALANLTKLLQKTKQGLNLIIMVTAKRILKTTTDNYKIFVKTVTLDKVPVIIVQTHLDDEEDPTVWAKENAHLFLDKGIDTTEIIGTAFPTYNPRRDDSRKWADRTCQESTDRVWAAIEYHASPTPVYYFVDGSFTDMLRKTWIGIMKLFSFHFNMYVVELLAKAVQEALNCSLEYSFEFAQSLVLLL